MADTVSPAGVDDATLQRLRETIVAGIPNGRRLLTVRRLEAAIDQLIATMQEALGTDDPPYVDETLIMLNGAQWRALQIAPGPAGQPRLQALHAGFTANTLEAEERRLFDRNLVTWALLGRLRSEHPALARPHAGLTPEEQLVFATLTQLGPALREAQAHTVPGDITPDWLDRLAGLLAQLESVLGATAAENRHRAWLCSTMASAAFALGRGREQTLQPKAARDAYARAAALYDEAGEPEDAATAQDKAAWLQYALTADVDAGSFDDLRRVAGGIADPLERAAAFGRLSGQATQANDHYGALGYAEKAAACLVEAGFADPAATPIGVMASRWVDAACRRRTGLATTKLLNRVSEQWFRILDARHTQAARLDPAGARAIEAATLQVGAVIRALLAENAVAEDEIHAGLRPYIELPTAAAPPASGNDRLLALMPRIDALREALADPSEAMLAEADTLLAEASALGQAGPIANIRLIQAQARQRRGDPAGAEAAAAAGEAALLPGGAAPETLTDAGLFGLFLMLRARRLDIAAGVPALERMLDLAQGAIAAIEADRYRINVPVQQGAYLADRTAFYEMAAFTAFKLERWDRLIEVMDLFRSRSALRGRLAPPMDADAALLAQQVAAMTQAIDAAPPEQAPTLRERRRELWNLLSIARMRGAAGRGLPALTLAAVQEALAPDEAAVSWMWVAEGILLVLAIDQRRVHAERIILTAEQREALANHVEQTRSGRMPRNSMAANVQPVAEAVLPPGVRAFVAAAKHLIFSPHRALHLVPLHAGQFDGQFLIERASVRYVPNLGSVVLPWQGTQAGEVIAVGINQFGRSLPPLQNAEAEAQSVADAWAAHGDPATALLGDAATRAAFTSLPLERCRCLHLATHGQSVYSSALQGDPFASRLCFRDGDLEALSLADLPLRAELVVMSACHSGQRALDLPGLAELPGDDLFGLQAALFQAGVRSVIGALWPVDDSAAQEILPELHRGLARGARPDVALQRAFCSYLRQEGARRAIYYWAPLFMSSIGRLPPPEHGVSS